MEDEEGEDKEEDKQEEERRRRRRRARGENKFRIPLHGYSLTTLSPLRPPRPCACLE
jgi:hypothetical protein